MLVSTTVHIKNDESDDDDDRVVEFKKRFGAWGVEDQFCNKILVSWDFLK